ncbi:MAG: SUMF1/EgtB/PvdO family nonheme iron enzyme [Terriglobales bacterium]
MRGVQQRWREAQAASDQLWQAVKPPTMLERPVPERHRLVFYLGHLEAFDWNLLAPPLELKAFHAEWDQLFAFGIDPIDGSLPSDPPSAWPAVEEIAEYNRRLRGTLQAALARQGGDGLEQRLEVALEHRWMHVETLSYLFHNLDYAQKQPGPAPQAAAAAPPATSVPVEVPEGTATLGRGRDAGFGWDNEFDAHLKLVPAFSADRYKITNGEYLAFVGAGAAPPHFWRQRERQWYYRGMFAETPLPLDHPVYVTHAEAAAYCAWKGRRLPTEAEWHRMSYGTPSGDERAYPWGEASPRGVAGNFDLRGWDTVPTQACPTSASAWGVEDLLGNGWEWTAAQFGPFPGFKAFDFYPGYSANFFDGQHYVMKGGSARTAACLLRRSFRNWFQPHYPYAYAGFRSVT